jgi:3,4-dihydroxyphenylacetate 2,3-dioxygenase
LPASTKTAKFGISNRQVGEYQWDIASSEFNRQMDLRVLELWCARRYREFIAALPEYATKCSGDALMADTAMLFGVLGWESYAGMAEQLCDYFSSSGTGQGKRRIGNRFSRKITPRQHFGPKIDSI